MGYKIAIVGVTGLVGSTMLKILGEGNFPIELFDEIHLFASVKSEKRTVYFLGKSIEIKSLTSENIPKLDIALFALSSELSRDWTPIFLEKGAFVIDNSSMFRMDDNVPLVVPEVNSGILDEKSKLIANPNCSTIQLVVALNQIQQNFGIERIIISTYQSVSGAGKSGLEEYQAQVAGSNKINQFPFKIFANSIPQIGDFLDNGYCTEEMKLILETRKIFNDNSIDVFPTVVRVPVEFSHSESVTIFTKKTFEPNQFVHLLNETEGVILSNEIVTQLDVTGKDMVYISRLRFPICDKNSAQMWIVADNIRKGAATNAIQIAHLLIQKGLL